MDRPAFTEALEDAQRPRGGLAPAHLARVLDAIEARLAERLTIPTIAAVIPMSPFHFARAFRVSTGMPPHRYILERRLAVARETLATKAWPVATVARHTGFRTASHFTDVFRRYVGETPARYRTTARIASSNARVVSMLDGARAVETVLKAQEPAPRVEATARTQPTPQ
jgi:AraC-like DNA-binding protein